MKKITIYSKPNCHQCTLAKQLAIRETDGKNIDIVVIDVTTFDNPIEQLSRICNKDVRTVPQILIDDECIGGYTEFADELKKRI